MKKSKSIKVSKDFDSLSKQNALIICSGVKNGNLFVIADGEVIMQETITIPKPEFSDRKTLSMRSGRGQTLGYSSVYRTLDGWEKSQYLKELHSKMKSMLERDNYEAIYLFAPNQMITEIKRRIPGSEIDKIVIELRGNYTNEHPFALLKRIDDELKEEAEDKQILNPEAAEILKKTESV